MAQNRTTLRFRHSSSITVAAIIMLIAGISVASWQPYLLILLVVPAAIAIWSWRAGTDVDREAITVRAALGRRRIPWRDISEVRPDGHGHVEAVLASGSRVTLTAVAVSQLSVLFTAAAPALDSEA